MSGLTLIELLVMLAVATVLIMLTVPRFTDMLARRRLEGVANELSADLQYTRSEAVSRRLNASLSTSSDGTAYTVAVATSPSATTLKSVALPAGITVTANTTLTYDAMRGMPSETAGGDVSILVQSTKTSARLQVVNNYMGRVQLCSPSGSLVGYTPCS